MNKSYQKKAADASAVETAAATAASISLAEVVDSAQEGLLALAVGTGRQVMQTMFDDDVEELCGPRDKHNPERRAYRHGRQPGSVSLGGRRLPVSRPRVRAVDRSGELSLPSYELFRGTELWGRLAVERMLAGLSTRRDPVGLEPIGQEVSARAVGTRRSSVSRRFVAATETALAELLARRLESLDLVALLIDGVHVAESCCVVALASTGRASSIHSPWSRARPRTRRWSGSCWSTSAIAVSTSHAPCSS